MFSERDDPRGRKIAEQLNGYLDEGEAFLVRCEDEEIRVFDAECGDELERASCMREDHPELYGRMLRAESSLERAAGPIRKLIWLAVVLLIVAIATGWLADLVDIEVERLQSFLVYLGLVIVTAILTSTIKGVLTGIRYRGMREDLLGAIDSAGLSVDAVLTELAGDHQFSTLEERLKREPSRRRRYD